MVDASIIMRWLRSWSAVACRPKSFSDAIIPFLHLPPSGGGPSIPGPACWHGRAEIHQGMMQWPCQKLFINIFQLRSEEHTSELQSLMRISYAVFCLKKKQLQNTTTIPIPLNYYNIWSISTHKPV